MTAFIEDRVPTTVMFRTVPSLLITCASGNHADICKVPYGEHSLTLQTKFRVSMPPGRVQPPPHMVRHVLCIQARFQRPMTHAGNLGDMKVPTAVLLISVFARDTRNA